MRYDLGHKAQLVATVHFEDMRILVVEDDPLTRLDLETRLVALGHSVFSAGAPQEAITLGMEHQPEIIISDWQLGDSSDGLDVCNSLLRVNPQLYIIMFTGASREELLQNAFGIPLKNVLAKPLEQKDLENILLRAKAKIKTHEI